MADRKMRVLIVDDANLVRLYYRQVLEEAGFEVEEALNGLEGLEKLLVRPPDALIVDINMPRHGWRHLPERAEAASLAAVLNSGLCHQHRVERRRRRSRARRRRQFLLRQADRPRGSRAHHGDVLRRSPMNEFLEQFLVEARELIEQVTADLLALERDPGDRASLDGSFRAFHTLKGGAGIVDFAAMGRAMHAAEDVLSMVRRGDRPVTAGLIGDCLACLDQVVQWLDSIEESGELPSEADAAADRLANRFAAGEGAIEAAKIETAAVGAEPAVPTARSQCCASRSRCSQSAARDWRAGSRRPGAWPPMSFAIWDTPTSLNESSKAVTESRAGSDPNSIAHAIELAIESLDEAPAPDPVAPVAIRTDPLSRSLRVDAERVDALVSLTGELTVAKNAYRSYRDAGAGGR